MTHQKLIDGVKVTMGGTEFVVPPLSIGQVKRIRAELQLFGQNIDPKEIGAEHLDSIVKVVCMALQRNYPDMTEEKLADILDLSNLAEIIRAVLGVSGIKKDQPGPA